MRIRAILDTNLWISYLIGGELRKLDELLSRTDLLLLFSIELLQEFIEVALRPKFKKYFSHDDLDELLDLFDEYVEHIEIKSQISLCRDPKDNFLLALALDGKADFLVTGDEDLLEMKTIGETAIVTITEFFRMS